MPKSLGILCNFCRKSHLRAHLATRRHGYGQRGACARPGHGRRVFAVTLMVILGCSSAIAQVPASCALRLSVKLTPDVPSSRDTGFLSSLLGNQSGYQLTLQRQRSDFDIDLELTGPGPDYLCQSVVDAIRRDGRVVFVQVDPDPVLN